MSVSMYFTCIARGSCRSHDTAVCTRGHRAVAWSHKAAGSLLPVQGQSPGSQTHTHFNCRPSDYEPDDQSQETGSATAP